MVATGITGFGLQDLGQTVMGVPPFFPKAVGTYGAGLRGFFGIPYETR